MSGQCVDVCISTMDDLMQRAREVAKNAYAPYSGVQVGCALETASGRIVTGCNVENASYGLTMCAERNALFRAVTEEGPTMQVARLAVIALGHEFSPCGACRQVTAEFSLPDGATDVAWIKDGQTVGMKVRDLLPAAFSFDA